MKFVATIEELREGYGAPHDLALRKELRALDLHARNFIANSPFVLIGSSDGKGHADVTPKGDRPGFVAMLDDRTLAIPDRPGNNRLDTLENVVANPEVGLLFLIPGMNETLRINGTARVTFDEALRAQLAVEGRIPLAVMVVGINAVYMHCAKAFLRSGLWNPEGWQPRDAMPTLGEILKDQLSLPVSADETDRNLDESYSRSMW
ncbi:MAG: pyridoxamine 5'-phosphate oxidase family protein [Pseudomonadota bacterium]|nr:pyridoxamine 5'-phosphate oxidase family protein [Pseudomonadota bacterium]